MSEIYFSLPQKGFLLLIYPEGNVATCIEACRRSHYIYLLPSCVNPMELVECTRSLVVYYCGCHQLKTYFFVNWWLINIKAKKVVSRGVQKTQQIERRKFPVAVSGSELREWLATWGEVHKVGSYLWDSVWEEGGRWGKPSSPSSIQQNKRCGIHPCSRVTQGGTYKRAD